MSSILNLDLSLFHWLNRSFVHSWTDRLALFLSDVFTWWVLALFIACVGLVMKRWHLLATALVLAISMGSADAISARVLKPVVQRVRPCYQLKEVRAISGCGGRFGFPSNHAANGMAAAVAIGSMEAQLFAALVFVAALFVGASRVYLGVHYPTDVAAGFVVGSLIAKTVVIALRKPVERRLAYYFAGKT